VARIVAEHHFENDLTSNGPSVGCEPISPFTRVDQQAPPARADWGVILRAAPVATSDEDKPRVILDYDHRGNLISIEVLDASQRVEEPRSMTLTA
jgi:YD repeat-containing protein